jgi:hypothetical protein
MRRREAIKLLREMKAELDSFTPQGVGIPSGPPLNWLRKIHGYADQFFEKGSHPHYMLGRIELTLRSTLGPLDKQHTEAIAEAKSRIDHCIDHIERFGLYRPPRKNLLATWSNSLIILILSAIGAGTFLVGKYTSDVSAMELRRELKELRDSLHSAAPPAPVVVTVHDTIWVEDTAKISVSVPAEPSRQPKQ